jgi:hypothetical protein
MLVAVATADPPEEARADRDGSNAFQTVPYALSE